MHLQYVCCYVLQYIAVHCNVLLCVAECGSVLMRVTVTRANMSVSEKHREATYTYYMGVELCCRLLQCIVVCCNVLQSICVLQQVTGDMCAVARCRQ